MRICYLAWHGSVHTRRWAGWFAERGHDVHVITCGDADARDLDHSGEPLPLRYRVHDIGAPRFGRLGYIVKLGAARRAVSRVDPDVLHVHWLTSYGMLALAADRARLPLVATAHGDDLLIAPRRAPMRWLVRRVLRAAKLITVPRESMRQNVEQLLAPQEPPVGGIAAFQYGVETNRLEAAGRQARKARTDPGSMVHEVRIVSARALLPLYRIDAVIDATALLAGDGVDVRLDLLGDGPQRSALLQRARDRGIEERCTFHGAVTPARVEQVVGASDVYVSVAESDGVSLALLEALALGTVPVLSDIPANRPWVNDGATGILVEVDPVDIADGIRRALRLDRARVAADNLAVVAERADRDTNLAACELLIDALVGVVWEAADAASIDEGSPGRDAA